MVDEYNRGADVGVTREHIRNLVDVQGVDRAALVEVFVASLGSGRGVLQTQIAEIFADNVLAGVR